MLPELGVERSNSEFTVNPRLQSALNAAFAGNSEPLRKVAEESIKNAPKHVYKCDLCGDEQWRMYYRDESGNKIYREPHHKNETGDYTERCVCFTIQQAKERLEKSGLAKQIAVSSLDNYVVTDEWQRVMLTTAKAYSDKPDGWLLLCGQNGSGKTHLCAAIFGKMLQNVAAVYMPWVESAKEIKGMTLDTEDYNRAVGRLTRTKFLYIDDLFKTNRRGRGDDQFSGITDADTRLAFEVLDYRYRNTLPTMISCEWSIEQLYEIDPAIASRIAQMCQKDNGDGYCFVNRDISRDYRLRGLKGV